MLIGSRNFEFKIPVSSRVKSWSSIVRKIERGVIKIKRISDLQDLIGIRIILLFERDINAIENILESQYSIKRKYSTKERLEENQFDYAAKHIILRLPNDWITTDHENDFKYVLAEVQIRTMAQHLWAEASRVLQYKQEKSVPQQIRRNIFRLSALLEIVDLEFERLLLNKDEYRGSISQGSLEKLTLDSDIIEIFLDKYFPKENKIPGHETYSDLIADLAHFGVTSTDQLKDLIDNHLKEALNKERTTISRRLKSGFFLDELEEERVMEGGVFFSHTGLLREMLDLEFGKKWKERQISK